jgi:DNA-binding CsgD family transcriptional regulator
VFPYVSANSVLAGGTGAGFVGYVDPWADGAVLQIVALACATTTQYYRRTAAAMAERWGERVDWAEPGFTPCAAAVARWVGACSPYAPFPPSAGVASERRRVVMPGLVGREAELQAAAGFLDRLAEGPAGLLFEGEPGIGKTTVWAETVERARGQSRVLCAQPAEAEARLAFAALSDLLEPLLGDVLAELPSPQRHALALALLEEEPGARPVDQRAISAATLSVLRVLAGNGPVLVAIDDLQWLDRPSARVLQFAVRRLTALPVGVVGCRRLGDGHVPALDLERALLHGHCTRIRLGALSLTALCQILEREGLGRSLPRRALSRVMQAAGGNPFFALEIARSLPQELPATGTLELPQNLRGLVEHRIAGLPKSARQVLLAAAAADAPTIELVTSATSGRRADLLHALDRAAATGLITMEGSRIRFGHPLFAASVYSSAQPWERRLTHSRLAPLVDDLEERARHLALGTETADQQVAAVVAAAAEHARKRGAPEVAAELAEHARILTPPERAAEHLRRSVQVAEYQFHAGELRRAREVLESVLRIAPRGPPRTDALRLLGEIHYHEDSFPEAIRLFEEALGQADNDPGVQCSINLSLAFGSVVMGDFEAAPPRAYRALRLAEQAAEPASVAEALAVVAMADFHLGRGLDEAKIERALRLEDPYRQVPVQLRPSLIAGYLALYVGELQRCWQLLGRLRERIIESGQDSDLPVVSSYLSWCACWRGAMIDAVAFAAEAVESAARIEANSLRCWALAVAAVSAAYVGDVDPTKRLAAQCHSLAAETGNRLAGLWANWALSLLALSQDDPRAANAALEPLAATFEDHVPEPARALFLPDQIEALIALGRLNQAERMLTMFEEAARRLDRSWALMLAGRCRALLLAARGDLDGSSAAARDALARGAELEMRMEVARTFLVAGRVERRRRCKRQAAEWLQQALESFEQAGACLWAERARAELCRVGLRHTASSELTASECRVAELAASGRTNREIAAQLFMSGKTVEANLARVYHKLGIRSRAELGARLAGTSRS